MYERIAVIRDQSVHMSYSQTTQKCMIPHDGELPKYDGSIVSKYFPKLYFVDISYIVTITSK